MKRWPIAVALALLAAACSPTSSAGGDGVDGPVIVSAAASLTNAFDTMAAAFEAAHPGVTVSLNIAGSSLLREQILEGAPVDVYASANIANMDQIVAAGDAAAAVVFAGNTLEIAVPAGNPTGVTGLEDFGDETLILGLCAQEVPCGDLARRVLARAGIVPSIDTSEPDVRALLTKIEVAELDAGIVYTSDVRSSSEVAGITIPRANNALTEYPIARLVAAPNPIAADAFVAFVLSEEGREILVEHGFVAP